MAEQNSFPARANYRNPQVAESYDRDRVNKLLHHIETRAIRKLLTRFAPESSVLDLPCGTGRLLHLMVDRFAHVTGVDISPQMLDVARRRYEQCDHVTLKQSDATTLPFADGTFDVVFSTRFFGHTPPDIRLAVLRELARVTRNRVALVLYVRDPLITMRKRLQQLARPPKGPWYPIASKRELPALFGQAGLQIEQIVDVLPFMMESRIVIARKETRTD